MISQPPLRNTSGSLFRLAVTPSGYPDVLPINTFSLAVDDTNHNSDFLNGEDPGVASTSSLFPEFLTSFLKCSDLLDLLKDYHDLCQGKIANLQHVVLGSGQHSKTAVAVKWILQQELNTWRLITLLYRDRVQSELKDDIMMDLPVPSESERLVADQLLESDKVVRQSQLVVDWLESIAKDQMGHFVDNVECYTKNVYWENTLHALKRRTGSAGVTSALVTELDPDAPVRLQRSLVDLDSEDDNRLLKDLFALIRAGMFEQAQRLCEHCGQAWRAATLKGWMLYHDPNITSDSLKLQPVEGNPQRGIWKACCWRMAEEKRLNRYERAIYAALSGNIKPLLPVCESWEDCVWAHFKVMTDLLVEQELMSSGMAHLDADALPQEYLETNWTMKKVFEEVKATQYKKVMEESTEHHHVIQKALILEDLDSLMKDFSDWLTGPKPLPPHLLRFMTHLVLFYNSLGIALKEDVCVDVIKRYIRVLIQEDQWELIASYVRQLPVKIATEQYASLLETISQSEQRKRCLHLANDAGLDVVAITKLVVKTVLDRDIRPDTIITPEELEKIDIIDWLLIDPTHRTEALKQSNAIMRKFLAAQKLDAVNTVFSKLPENLARDIYCHWEGLDMPLPAEDENAVREHLCIKDCLDAHKAFNDWNNHINSAPQKPNPVPQNQGKFTVRVANEVWEKEYQSKYAKWEANVGDLTIYVKKRIYSVLFGTWMVDNRQDALEDLHRSCQMAKLRSLYLPRLSVLLLYVLQRSNQHQEALRLADIIASDQHRLYEVFSKKELSQFLQRLRDSSLFLLDNRLDPLGYQFKEKG